jgi:hypothetical protein
MQNESRHPCQIPESKEILWNNFTSYTMHEVWLLSNKLDNKQAKAVCCCSTYLSGESEEWKTMALTCSCCYVNILTLYITASTTNKEGKESHVCKQNNFRQTKCWRETRHLIHSETVLCFRQGKYSKFLLFFYLLYLYPQSVYGTISTCMILSI